MKDHLKPKPLVIAERFKFHRRNQHEGETVAQYLAKLRRLTQQCDFKDNLQEALRDRFVCGLRSEVIQRRLLTEENLTLQKAYDLAHSVETANKQASELQASTKTAIAVQRVAPPRPVSTGVHQNSYRCGKTGHHPDRCFFKSQKCRACGKRGHIAKMCKKSDKGTMQNAPKNGPKMNESKPTPKRWPHGQAGHRAGYVDCELEEEVASKPETLIEVPDAQDLFTLVRSERGKLDSYMLEPEVNGVILPMELDTGASASIIYQQVWEETFGKSKLMKCNTLLRTYSGEQLKVLGQLKVTVKYNDQVQQLPLLVVAGDGPSLWGRDWLAAIQLNWAHIKQVRTGLEPLLQKYSEVFQEELGTLKGIEAKLVVKENAVPKFHKLRSVPYAIRGAIEKDLERLESLGVIEKTNHSEWAAPIVPVPKADGSICICGDYKVTINPVLQVDQYPVPRVEDLFATLESWIYRVRISKFSSTQHHGSL